LNGTLLATGSITGGTSTLNLSQSGIAVNAGSTLDLVVSLTSGHTFTGADMTGVSQSITLTTAPEPSSIAILVSALLGLLAYAWRKRR
jgi:hypothetical protein